MLCNAVSHLDLLLTSYDRELFAPILPIIPVKDVDEADSPLDMVVSSGIFASISYGSAWVEGLDEVMPAYTGCHIDCVQKWRLQ